MRKAVIDLGTNTFHLFIVEINDGQMKTLYKEKIAVKIGQNGISKGKIASDAVKRAVHALQIFKTVIDQFEVSDIKGVATSAIRNAKNGKDVIERIAEETGIAINIISGDLEAELIFEGVKAAVDLSSTNQLVMDIGGGSVEFIIGNKEELLWKRSFEIGAQRLLDKFHASDPMPADSVDQMFDWLAVELEDLKQALVTFKPVGLIGCSGTFDTLSEIFLKRIKKERKLESTTFNLPIKDYHDIHRDLLIKDKSERLEIPGMVSMRVDMIVVASCLISFVLEHLDIKNLTACTYALKEGLLFSKKPLK